MTAPAIDLSPLRKAKAVAEGAEAFAEDAQALLLEMEASLAR
jgi:hypothetical protein